MIKKGLGLIFLFSLCCFVQSASAATQQFPFLAEVSANEVNIRAGENKNFESLGRIKKGAKVVVVGKSYNWYKIELPSEAKSYINQDYIQMLDNSTGVVTGEKVNVRAGAGMNFSVIGKLIRGTQVRIVSKESQWYRIVPLQGMYGWIADQFIVFNSPDVSGYQMAKAVIVPIAVKSVSPENHPVDANVSTVIAEKIQNPHEENRTGQDTPKAQHTSSQEIYVSGRVEILEGDQEMAGINYKLVTDDQSVYYLRGPQKIFNEFLHNQVEVQGLRQDLPWTKHTVVEVFRINLVL